MNDSANKTALVSVFSPVLMLSLYGGVYKDAVWALTLSGVFLIFFSMLIYFLRGWLSAVWVRIFIVFMAALAAQMVWNKQGVEPWWVLAALGLLLPTVEEIRLPQKRLALVGKVVIFEIAALFFFVALAALKLTESRFFWEQPAGHLSLFGLIALVLGMVETRREKSGA